MRPYEIRSTDALQNFTEALLAVQLLPPGVYVSMHNQVLEFPAVEKDYGRGTFGRPIDDSLDDIYDGDESDEASD